VGLVVADRMKSFRPKAEADAAVVENSGGINQIKRVKTSRFGVAHVLRVFPPVVEFHGIETGTLYVMTLTVQNTGNTVRRVRFQAPKTSAFRIKQQPAPGLAPGLDTTVDVEFFAESEEDFHDKLIVTSGTHAIEVPLHAFAPAPKVVFDGFVDLGLCVAGQSMARYIEFKNEGMIMGEFSIEYDENLPITITPAQGVLHPANPIHGAGRGGLDDLPMGGGGRGRRRGRARRRRRLGRRLGRRRRRFRRRFRGHQLAARRRRRRRRRRPAGRRRGRARRRRVWRGERGAVPADPRGQDQDRVSRRGSGRVPRAGKGAPHGPARPHPRHQRDARRAAPRARAARGWRPGRHAAVRHAALWHGAHLYDVAGEQRPRRVRV
jgi:hypothetical protein